MEAFGAVILMIMIPYGIWRIYLHICRPEIILRERELELRRRQQRLDIFRAGSGVATQLALWFFRR
jgi:hypothetical protein